MNFSPTPKFFLVASLITVAPAAYALSGGSTTPPTGTSDPGWANVGFANNATGSVVYIGSYSTGFWALSAAHVILSQNVSSVTINGSSYGIVGGSVVQLANTGDSTHPYADLCLFRVSGDSALSSLNNLTLATSAPSTNGPSSNITVIGWGGGAESYGTFAATSNNNSPGAISVANSNGDSWLFYGLSSTTQLIAGDSGGAMFNKIGSSWQLVGISEASGTSGSNYVAVGTQLSNYTSQINGYITAVPEPSEYGLMAGGVAFAVVARRRFRKRAA